LPFPAAAKKVNGVVLATNWRCRAGSRGAVRYGQAGALAFAGAGALPAPGRDYMPTPDAFGKRWLNQAALALGQMPAC